MDVRAELMAALSEVTQVSEVMAALSEVMAALSEMTQCPR
jgi:hypothetical protein